MEIGTSLLLSILQPPPADSDMMCVLKDKNFLDEQIDIGGQREWFLQQVDGHVNLKMYLLS